MSGRGRSKGRSSGGRGRGNGSGRTSASSGNSSNNGNGGGNSKATNNQKKTLAENIYYIGSAKQASDFTLVTNFILNHIKKTFTNGDDIGTALEERKEKDFTRLIPTMQQSADADKAKAELENKQFQILYEAEIAVFVQQKNTYMTNKGKAYALIWGQCNKALQNKLQARKDYESMVKGNPIKLLDAIEEHSMSYLENRYEVSVVLDGLRNLINLKQKDDELLTDYTR
jgi:hypothetical protein